MSYKVDYSSQFTIKQSGRDAFNAGMDRDDCPISRRTCANGVHWWLDGWDEESAKPHKGREAEPSQRCSGDDCEAIDGRGHSVACEKEHDSVVNNEQQLKTLLAQETADRVKAEQREAGLIQQLRKARKTWGGKAINEGQFLIDIVEILNSTKREGE